MNRQKPPVAADQTVFTEHGPLCLPQDLREWVPEQTLVKWISEEFGALQQTATDTAEPMALAPESRARTMLAVLVFAYTTRNLASEDVSRSCCSDETYRGLCRKEAPFKQELTHFRRKFRQLLENALTGILARAVKERFSLSKLAPGMEYSLRCRAVDRIDSAVLMDRWDE